MSRIGKIPVAIPDGVSISLEERAIPIRSAVRGACEVLGFDPLYLANEGRLICISPANQGNQVLSAMRNHPLGAEAVQIGVVSEKPEGRVLMVTEYGTRRVVDMLSGEMLPRIC